jgi:hypothetical protein
MATKKWGGARTNADSSMDHLLQVDDFAIRLARIPGGRKAPGPPLSQLRFAQLALGHVDPLFFLKLRVHNPELI